MIKIDGVTRTYDNFLAVDDVSFEIGSGEIVGLLGHNGAGKTTIMKMITGFLEPTAGTIKVNGKAIDADRKRIQQDIGYLPENCPLYPEMSVAEYLDYTAALHNVPEEERPEAIRDAIRRTGLQDKAMQRIATLSRGYRQRTGVAQAILHAPDILILDEPTNGLDPTQIQHMRQLIRELARSSTVIVSTHILQEVQAVCDRVIILKNGRKVMDTRLDELQSHSKLLLCLQGEGAEAVVRQCDGVHAVSLVSGETGSGQMNLSVTVTDGEDRQETAAGIAASLHDQGMRLYSMQYETKNLETLFVEISAP